ncbi:unnamed protein product [Fraxinus pennsylvanica]|uniref:Uncharacterized protein n=1 Tax=Fraxinus pennsylvanica TaxID=56036 RepID=A0AAD1ZHU3_9LAMI|nr:unnamed protein product [Fraxinus pennsylvanica]
MRLPVNVAKSFLGHKMHRRQHKSSQKCLFEICCLVLSSTQHPYFFRKQTLSMTIWKIPIKKNYLEDINEKPESRMFWPCQIWKDCVKDISAVQDPVIFRGCAVVQFIVIGALAVCYNNIQVFRGVETLAHGLTTKVVDGTKTISDFYRTFYDFTCMLKSKIDDNDPNATKTKDRVEAILKTLQGCQNILTGGRPALRRGR